MTKVCLTCGLEKPITEFHKQATKKNPARRKPHCRECWSKIRKDKTPEHNRRYNLKQCYGLTPEEYDSMLHLQNGVCAICGGTETVGRLAVDHCHETGKIRGLLCTNCNQALGKFKDDPTILANAITYLGGAKCASL